MCLLLSRTAKYLQRHCLKQTNKGLTTVTFVPAGSDTEFHIDPFRPSIAMPTVDELMTLLVSTASFVCDDGKMETVHEP